MSAITKYFVGGEVEAFYQGTLSGLSWSTAAGRYDPDFSRGAVSISAAFTQYINVPLTSPQTECYPSFQIYHALGGQVDNPAGTQIIQFLNSSLVPLYRVMCVGGTWEQPVMQMQYYNGTSWLDATGSSAVLIAPTSQLHKWDFHIKVNSSSGILQAWMDGIPFANFSGNNQFVTPNQVAAVWLNPFSNFHASDLFVSEGMIFDVSTLGRRLYTLGETANGTNSQWTGTVTDINEVGTFNDSNFIQTDTANQTSTFVTSTITSIPAQQYLVSGLVVAGRILIGAVGPQNLKGSVVVGGTTYNSTNNVANLLTSFGYTWADFPTNPNTGLDWTVGIINAGIETGWESLT